MGYRLEKCTKCNRLYVVEEKGPAGECRTAGNPNSVF